MILTRKQNLSSIVGHFIGKGNTETIVVEYSQDKNDYIPRIQGQWVQLANGHIQVTYTREQYEYCKALIDELAEDN